MIFFFSILNFGMRGIHFCKENTLFFCVCARAEYSVQFTSQSNIDQTLSL